MGMTYSARLVLDDCHLALEMLEKETDLSRWRVLWAGAVALLRAVGHVLHKVDGADPARKRLISAAFSEWKRERENNALFWEFIEKERNSILKEYSSSVHPSDEVHVAFEIKAVSPTTGEEVVFKDICGLNENIYRPMLDGFREGDDARDVYSEALSWWEDRLTEIEVYEAIIRCKCRRQPTWEISRIRS